MLELAISTRGASACVRNTPTGLPDCTSKRLVALEPLQRRDDPVEALPIARGAADAAIDHELARPLGDLGVEIVHEHAQRGFGEPALGGERRAARRADAAGVVDAGHGVPFLKASRRCQQARRGCAAKAHGPPRRRGPRCSRALPPPRYRAPESGPPRAAGRAPSTHRGPASRTGLERSGAWKSHPCAAARSSMARMFDDILGHGEEAARAMRRHRDMVLLIGGSRDRIDARRIGPLLVLRDERRRRHLRDHEAGIQPRPRREEGRKPRQGRIDQHGDAALGERADLAKRQRDHVGREGDRLRRGNCRPR